MTTIDLSAFLFISGDMLIDVHLYSPVKYLVLVPSKRVPPVPISLPEVTLIQAWAHPGQHSSAEQEIFCRAPPSTIVWLVIGGTNIILSGPSTRKWVYMGDSNVLSQWLFWYKIK